MEATGGGSAAEPLSASCRVRGVLGRIGDKWAIYVVDRLGDGPRRFSELLRGIDGITARMLGVTLRAAIEQLVSWADTHLPEIEAAQAAYDGPAEEQPCQEEAAG